MDPQVIRKDSAFFSVVAVQIRPQPCCASQEEELRLFHPFLLRGQPGNPSANFEVAKDQDDEKTRMSVPGSKLSGERSMCVNEATNLAASVNFQLLFRKSKCEIKHVGFVICWIREHVEGLLVEVNMARGAREGAFAGAL
jgi:hypothetical protein